MKCLIKQAKFSDTGACVEDIEYHADRNLDKTQIARLSTCNFISFGTIAVYLLSPLLIAVWGWKSVFVFSAFCGIVMIFLWNRYCRDIKPVQKKDAVPSEKRNGKSLLNALMLGIMAAIVLQGMLRDGVTTWMPSYISETYHMSNITSILTGVVLPLFGILCFQIATNLYMKKFTNPLMCAGVFFAAGAFSALALFCSTGHSAALSVLFSAMLTGCMHGVNLILICMIPPFFLSQGNVSTVAGVLNSCTYIGSAVSTYGIAVLSEQLGWRFTLLLWLLIAVLGTAICLICVKPWQNKWTCRPNSEKSLR